MLPYKIPIKPKNVEYLQKNPVLIDILFGAPYPNKCLLPMSILKCTCIYLIDARE